MGGGQFTVDGNQLKFTFDKDGNPVLLKPSIPMVKSHASFWRRSGRQRRQTLHHSKEIGLAKRLERHSPLRSTLTRRSLNSVQQRVC